MNGAWEREDGLKILRWFAVSFSLYSKIPMPGFKWQEDDMAHSLAFFPFVGAVIGALVYALNTVAPISDLHVAVRILLTIAIPLLITGGFHVDGFMDTEDALNSYGTMEKKLEILKDSHIGAFAVISLLKWYLIYGAGVTAILLNEKCDRRIVLLFALIFVVSRCICGLTSIGFKKARNNGFLYEETKDKQTGTVVFLIIQLIAALSAMAYLRLIYAAALILAFGLYTLYYRHLIYKEFGGATGDTAGFFVTTSEIVAAVTIAVMLLF